MNKMRPTDTGETDGRWWGNLHKGASKTKIEKASEAGAAQRYPAYNGRSDYREAFIRAAMEAAKRAK